MARLKEIYRKELAPKLKEELKLGNVMEVPRVTKITLNMGIGEAIGDKKIIEHAVADIEKITGQKAPERTVAVDRKPIAMTDQQSRFIGIGVTPHDQARAIVPVNINGFFALHRGQSPHPDQFAPKGLSRFAVPGEALSTAQS